MKNVRKAILVGVGPESKPYKDVFMESRVVSYDAWCGFVNDGDKFEITVIQEDDIKNKCDERTNDFFSNKADYCDYDVAFDHAWYDISKLTTTFNVLVGGTAVRK